MTVIEEIKGRQITLKNSSLYAVCESERSRKRFRITSNHKAKSTQSFEFKSIILIILVFPKIIIKSIKLKN